MAERGSKFQYFVGVAKPRCFLQSYVLLSFFLPISTSVFFQHCGSDVLQSNTRICTGHISKAPSQYTFLVEKGFVDIVDRKVRNKVINAQNYLTMLFCNLVLQYLLLFISLTLEGKR